MKGSEKLGVSLLISLYIHFGVNGFVNGVHLYKFMFILMSCVVVGMVIFEYLNYYIIEEENYYKYNPFTLIHKGVLIVIKLADKHLD